MINSVNVGRYLFAENSIDNISMFLNREKDNNIVIFFIDQFFRSNLPTAIDHVIEKDDLVYYVSTIDEPTVELVDEYASTIKKNIKNVNNICAIVGMGAGVVLDVTKAVANLITNEGSASEYQGWDLVKNKAIYKIGIPTISGTGAEASRTCVLTNKKTGIKLGMNSDYSVYDQLILDPMLSKTVPRDQYFYTAMDSYFHCIESKTGQYRNPFADAYSEMTISLCEQIFESDDMMSDENRSKLMVASYLSGLALGSSYVGIIHPVSAALSVVYNVHHCVSNCMSMLSVGPRFYLGYYNKFKKYADMHGICIPTGLCFDATDIILSKLYDSMMVHKKPLVNALGNDYEKTLTRQYVYEIFRRI